MVAQVCNPSIGEAEIAWVTQQDPVAMQNKNPGIFAKGRKSR
jgi:hypothetical protein